MIADKELTFICRDCSEVLPRSMAMKGRIAVKTNKGRCKPCHSRITSNRELLKHATLLPDNYVECNDCDRIMNKYKNGNPLYVKRALRTECRYCGSTDFSPFGV